MKVLVTGSSGHLGEALGRTFVDRDIAYLGVDRKPGEFTHQVGDLSEKSFVDQLFDGIDYVLHCATLHKPHVATHSKTDFLNSNILSTLNLLEAAKMHRVKGFIFTSTTSTFGDAMRPEENGPAIWVNEELNCIPKNIYGVTKTAAEDLCQIFARNENLPCLILRTSRFFWEKDDDPEKRDQYDDLNIKVNEYLNRRLDVEDAVVAHILALQQVEQIGFDKFILSATSPFKESDLLALNQDVPALLTKIHPEYEAIYRAKGWKMFPQIDRVYVNDKARKTLGWHPKYDFRYLLQCLQEDKPIRSELSLKVGVKGYHKKKFKDGIYPIK